MVMTSIGLEPMVFKFKGRQHYCIDTMLFLFFISDAKAMEAAGNGYYNPANPHNVYTPAQYPSAPPSYDDATKKNQ
jgi:hypothetical protein